MGIHQSAVRWVVQPHGRDVSNRSAAFEQRLDRLVRVLRIRGGNVPSAAVQLHASISVLTQA